MQFIAQRTINRFEMAFIEYKNESETYNKIIELELKNIVESERRKRAK